MDINQKVTSKIKKSELIDCVGELNVEVMEKLSELYSIILDQSASSSDKTTNNVSEHIVSLGEVKQLDSVSEVNISKTTNINEDNSNLNNKTEKKKQTICKYYRMNKCNKGKNCDFNHPKKCMYIINTGICNNKSCKFFHPQMCWASIENRQCLREVCRFSHIKGTVRHIRKTPQQIKIPNQYSQIVRPNQVRSYAQVTANHQSSKTSNHQTQSFLDKHPPPFVENQPPFLDNQLAMETQIQMIQEQMKTIMEFLDQSQRKQKYQTGHHQHY